jgi:hemolysin III
VGKFFRDTVSGLMHLGGVAAALAGTVVLVIKAVNSPDAVVLHLAAFLLFSLSLILLYTASSVYHLVKGPEKLIKAHRKVDHSMIFVLIAGTYTPIALLSMTGAMKWIYLIGIWALALFGVLYKVFIMKGPRWLTVAIYILMGWSAVFGIQKLYSAIGFNGIFWLLLGGFFYSAGAVIYALKKPNPSKNFGFHEIFHVFCLLGSLSHYWMILKFIN